MKEKEGDSERSSQSFLGKRIVGENRGINESTDITSSHLKRKRIRYNKNI